MSGRLAGMWSDEDLEYAELQPERAVTAADPLVRLEAVIDAGRLDRVVEEIERYWDEVETHEVVHIEWHRESVSGFDGSELARRLDEAGLLSGGKRAET